MIYFSQNLVFYRELKGYTQKKMAEMLEINIKRYQSWEEKRAEPSLENLMKTCIILGVTDLLSMIKERIYLRAA